MRKKSSKQGSGSYEVGRGRPPRATRWRPGQSGNPKGRPKGAKSLSRHLKEALDRTIAIQERGKNRKITTREAIAITLVKRALQGDPKALSYLLAHDSEIMEMTGPIKQLNMTMSLQEASEAYAEMLRRDGQGN